MNRHEQLDMSQVLAAILGGGRGTRLYPLTKFRSKPAVPLAGKYRLIDIPISNCINSDIRRVYILTQFNSVSLHRHVTRTFHFDAFTRGFVEILAAQQTLTGELWYQGTADAVRQNLRYFQDGRTRHVLILSGDQLYQMDFRRLLEHHSQTGAEMTIAALPVKREDASRFGILKTDADSRVTEFFEKPKDQQLLDHLRAEPDAFKHMGADAAEKTHLASMGIYLFDLDVLVHLLTASSKTDFGKEIIPDSIKANRVFAFVFHGYWEDIGTIESFHKANLDFASPHPKFDFYRLEAPIYTRSRFLPASRVISCTLENTLLGDGCILEEARCENSVIGIRSIIKAGARIKDSVLMGNDSYQSEADKAQDQRLGIPLVGIGKNVAITRAIIDKNARIGDNVVIENQKGLRHFDAPNYNIRDGVVIIPKSETIPPGTVI
jgi:glucose-1-phosphate adenylyltransferase